MPIARVVPATTPLAWRAELRRLVSAAAGALWLAAGTGALGQQAVPGAGVGRDAPVPMEAAPGTPPSRDHPPMFDPRRYTEDYRFLADPTQRSGSWWERSKYIPLDPVPETVLTLGGEIRARTEAYANNLFSRAPRASDRYVWERALPYADLHIGSHVRVFGQLGLAYSQGQNGGPSPLDETRADWLQGFVELTAPLAGGDLSGRFGRQVVSYGDGSLIDSRYGPNVLQSFDGAFVGYRRSVWRGDVFWARPVRNGPQAFDDRADGRQQIWGAIVGRDLPGLTRGVLELYYFGFENDQAAFNGKTGRENRHTLGLRHVGGTGALDWKDELIGQFGSFGSGNIGAYATAAEVGYTLDGVTFSPRLHVNGGVASGDRHPNGRDLGTFNALFPRGQYFSDTGLIGPYNLINTRIGTQLTLAPGLKIDALVGFYWRDSLSDAVYRNGGAPLFNASSGQGRFIATQFETVLEYAVRRGFDLRFTFADFEPGRFVQSTGPVAPVRFIGAETRLWF